MVTKQKVKEMTLRYMEAINSRDLSVIDKAADEFFAADYVWHFPGVTDLPPGPACIKKLLREILADNPNFTVILDDFIVEGDKMALRCTMHRTDPATGKAQHGMNLLISRFAGDQFVEDWELISPWEDEA
jgi:hypothetical protein